MALKWKAEKKMYETRMMGYNGITHSEYFIIIFVSFKITIWALWVLRNIKVKEICSALLCSPLLWMRNPLLFIDVKKNEKKGWKIYAYGILTEQLLCMFKI